MRPSTSSGSAPSSRPLEWRSALQRSDRSSPPRRASSSNRSRFGLNQDMLYSPLVILSLPGGSEPQNLLIKNDLAGEAVLTP